MQRWAYGFSDSIMSAAGHDLPVQTHQARVSSTPDNCRTHCTATNFRVVPRPDVRDRPFGPAARDDV
jgi:hypothetical protein